jgi:hypothetical protein
MLTVVWNPRGFHLIKVLENGRKFNAGHYVAEILEHCPSGTQLKQRTMSENCWCMRTVRGRIPPSYQLNILTRIECNRRHILHTPLISRRRTFISSGIARDVSHASHSRMRINFLQQ